jgi:hypothetical protein
MAKPDIVIVDGHAFSWQRLCELRRQRLEAVSVKAKLINRTSAMCSKTDIVSARN